MAVSICLWLCRTLMQCVLFPLSRPFYISCMALDIKEVLNILDTRKEVSITFIKVDMAKRKGGEVVTIPRAVLYGKRHANFTVNLKLPNTRIRKVHVPLITQINNQPVI